MLGLNLARIRGNPATTFIATLSGTVTNAALGMLYMLQKADVGLEKNDLRHCDCGTAALQRPEDPVSNVRAFLRLFALRGERSYVHPSLWDMPFGAFDFVYSGFVFRCRKPSRARSSPRKLWATFAQSYDVGYDNRQALTILAAMVTITAYLAIALFRFIRSINLRDVGALVAGFIILAVPSPSGVRAPTVTVLLQLPALLDHLHGPLFPRPTRAAGAPLFLALCLLEANFVEWGRFQRMFMLGAPPAGA